MFAFVELPVWLDNLLHSRVGFPGMDQGADETSRYLTDLWIDAYYLRWIGYISLLVIVAFIVTGFVTKKSGWAWAGAFTLFLPVFGQFALSMFFLSGLGVLRAGWLPFMDISWNVLSLGNMVYIPYWILMWFFGLFGWYAHGFIAWLFMASGAFLFVWGVMEWFNARFGGTGVAIRSIYRISRHPQYLGWILWSYGFMLFSMYQNNMKKSWGVESSLPWLLMTMVIIAMCLLEELKMKEKYGNAYEGYRAGTPFLLPLPRFLRNLLRMPARWIIGKRSPENNSDILKLTGTLTLVLVLASTTWVDFGGRWEAVADNTSHGDLSLDSVLAEIDRPGQGRRDYDGHIERIEAFGQDGIPVLLRLLDHPTAEVREFAAYALGHLDAREAGSKLIALVSDENGRVRNAAIQTLGTLRIREATPVLIAALQDPAYDGFRHSLYGSLAALQAEEAIPLLIEGTSKPPWYHQNTAMKCLYALDPDTCLPIVLKALSSEEFQIRRSAVHLMLQHPRPEALEALMAVTDDEDFETRFYAREAIRKIEMDEGAH